VAALELHDFLSRIWVNLIERPSGPLAFRFMLQPAMSAALAIRGCWRLFWMSRIRLRFSKSFILAKRLLLALL
jgi:hypothetical protein